MSDSREAGVRIPDTRTVDDKGRCDPEHMTDHELLVETVTVLRAVGDALSGLDMSNGVLSLMRSMTGR